MIHDETCAPIAVVKDLNKLIRKQMETLNAIMDLHKSRKDESVCIHCSKTGFWISYPCPTIQAIEKELG